MSLLKRYEQQTYAALGKLLPPELTNIIAKQRFVDFQARCSNFRYPMILPRKWPSTGCAYVGVDDALSLECSWFDIDGSPFTYDAWSIDSDIF